MGVFIEQEEIEEMIIVCDEGLGIDEIVEDGVFEWVDVVWIHGV